MATSLGTMSVLFLEETLIGCICFGLIYLITRHFELSAAGGLALVVFLLIRNLKYHGSFILYLGFVAGNSYKEILGCQTSDCREYLIF